MRIAIITYFAPNNFKNPEGGGITMATVNKINNLINQGNLVDLICFNEVKNNLPNLSVVNLKNNFLEKLSYRRNIYIVRFLSYIIKGIIVRRYLKKSSHYFDKIEIDDCEGLALFIPKSINYQLRVHGNYFMFGSFSIKNKFWQILFSYLDYKVLSKSLNLSLPSNFSLRYLKSKMNLSRHHSIVRLNAPFNYVPKEILYNNKINFIITDRLDFLKGGQFILDAISNLDSIYNGNEILIFNFIGDIRLSNSDLNIYKSFNSEKIKIQFYGQMSHEDVLKKLYTCDAFIAASNFETYSYTLFEAMNIGLPLIIPKKHVYYEFCHDIGLFYTHRNSVSLINQILKFVDLFCNKQIENISEKTHLRFHDIYNNDYLSE